MADNTVLFTRMAERIAHNADAPFGGAVVIVPPKGTDVIDYVTFDSQQNEAQFWGGILGLIQNVIQEMRDRERNLQGFGRPR